MTSPPPPQSMNDSSPVGQNHQMLKYICMVTHIASVQMTCSLEQQKYTSTGQGCQSCSWSVEQGKLIFPCPRSRLRLGLARRVRQSRAASACSSPSILRLNLVLTYGIPPEFRGGVHFLYLNHHTPSGQSRVYRVAQLRTGGVHCRESAGTGPVNLKVVPNECCLGRSPWTN